MELRAYDASRSPMGIVESYEYLRWTRRYSQCGDFEAKAIASPANAALLRVGHILWKTDDEEAAFVEHVERAAEGQEHIYARGRFATSALGRRIVWGDEGLDGDASEIAGQLIARHMLAPADPDRKIEGFAYGSPPLGYATEVQVSYGNLLAVVEGLCAEAGAGIKTAWDKAARSFTVSLYRGAESQAAFSREYENIVAQRYVEGELDHVSAALVGGDGEGARRFLVAVGGGSGIGRREAFVDGKGVSREGAKGSYAAALASLGLQHLAERAKARAFDAEINPHGNLEYRRDYDLGQVVRVSAPEWGVGMEARIAEVEETYDRDGRSLRITFGRGPLTLGQKLREGG